MTPPILVTAPTQRVVTVSELKAHLRVDHSDDDALIEGLEAAAVAHLDGWTGVLGRPIRSQQWRQEFTSSERARLAMPDVTEITVEAFDAAGDAVTVASTLMADYRGHWVEIVGGHDKARVTYTCGMKATQIPAAQMAVKLLVGHWYENRETVALGASPQSMPFAVDALVTAMRWVDF